MFRSSTLEANFVAFAIVMACLLAAGCSSRPELKSPDPQATEMPINTPEAAAELQRIHGR